MSEPTSVATGDQTPLRDVLLARFSEETDLQNILKIFAELCKEIGLDPSQYDGFYPAFKAAFSSWKAGALFQLLDGRAKQNAYNGQEACAGKRVLVVGAGPVGLRAAIEASLLGAKVDLVEKRTSFTRNNSLHLWPFLITDLKNLGAKKFYGRFCSSTIDHISIRILQSILLRACLILGVKVHTGIAFTKLISPSNANSGWTIMTTPTSSQLTSYHYDVIIGADGKQNSMPGFRSKEFRAKLALAITANYINSNTKQESSVPEISGVAYVYRQEFFNDLADKLGIELENIVYYKDETHYFVMTAKKGSLLKKGVLKKDSSDPALLLSKDNIDRKALERYATEAATYSTEGALGTLPFEKNHRGENDVALFDFTSLFAAQNAARIVERKGKKILLCLVGDSLLEPFWPTGSGCARGFLGMFDAAWMMKRFCTGDNPLEILEEREALLYLLPQTTPERLQKNHAAYSIDPKTRYPNLSELIPPGDISHLYDTDNSEALMLSRNQSMARSSLKGKTTKDVEVKGEGPAKPKHSVSIGENLGSQFTGTSVKPSPNQKEKVSSTPKESGETPTAEKTKHFWRKKQDAKPSVPKEKKPHSTAKNSSENKKVESSAQSSTTHTKPQRSESPANKGRGSELTTSKDKTPDHTSSSSPKKGSPGWFRLRGKNQRSKSESPERTTKKEEHGETKFGAEHPLLVGANASGREDVVVEETQMNVLDRIKHYNTKDAVVKENMPVSKAADASKSLKEEKGKTKGKGKDEAKVKSKDEAKVKEKGKEAKVKEKGKQEPKVKEKSKQEAKVKEKSKQEAKVKDKGKQEMKVKDKSKHEAKVKDHGKKDEDKKKHDKKEGKKEQSASKHWNPFKKSHKSEAAGDAKESGKKGKKTKGDKKSDQPPETADPGVRENIFGDVKERIERLKEQGLVTDGTDGDDVVLLTMVHKDGEEEDENSEQVDGGTSYPGGDVDPSEVQDEVDGGSDEIKDEGDHLNAAEEEEDDVISSSGPSSEVRTPSPVGVDESPVESSELSVMEQVKKLQISAQRSPALTKRARSFTAVQRSKEIDLSELSQKSQPQESHPLWKARVIQGLNRCLERFRKEHKVKVAKMTLEIINAIFSNVEKYPENDIFRRVRISSEHFTSQVWQYSEVSQFLARSGWVQIDDFIVLPMGTAVNIPQRVIDKHLNIVNQMLWSMQLEIPDSPSEVVKRKTKVRGRVFSLAKRESYATRLIEESMERISEEDNIRAVAAAKVRRNTMESGGSVGGRARRSLSPSSSEDSSVGGLQTVIEADGEEEVKATQVSDRKLEEAQTIKAATNARKVWEAMTDESKSKLETELYDLPPSKLAESFVRGSYVPSSYRRGLSLGGSFDQKVRRSSVETNPTLLADLGTLSSQVEEIAEQEENAVTLENTPLKNSIVTIEDNDTVASEPQLPEDISPPPTDELNDQSVSSQTSQNKEQLVSSPSSPAHTSEQKNHSQNVSPGSVSSAAGELDTSQLSHTEIVIDDEGHDPISSSNGAKVISRTDADQLRIVTITSRSGNSEKRESTSPVKSERNEYEKLTMEAAALSREKWKQVEEGTTI